MRIAIYPEKCIGVGQCVVAAPDFFSQNEDDGIVYTLRNEVGQDRLEEVRAAVRLCPTQAIAILED